MFLLIAVDAVLVLLEHTFDHGRQGLDVGRLGRQDLIPFLLLVGLGERPEDLDDPSCSYDRDLTFRCD